MVTNSTLEKVRALLLEGRLAEAEALYRAVVQSQPSALWALEGLGTLLFQLGRADEAASLFGRCLAIRPQSARTHANLGEALRVLGHLDQSLEHLRQAAALDPKLAQVFNSLGLIEFQQGRHSQAEAALREAIRLQPRMVAAYINLANVHHGRHELSDAITALRSALEVEADNPTALTNLGQVMSETRDLDLLTEAESLCRRAIARAPRLPQALESLGNVLRAAGRHEEAVACYQHAARIAPRRAMPHHLIGQVLQERRDFDQAARFYETARSLEPSDARFHGDFGSLAFDRGQFDDAARCFRQALECDPRSAESHHGLGLALLEEGRLELAEPSFREALRIDPRLAVSWCALARLQAELGDFDASCDSARTALAVRAGYVDAYWRLSLNLKGRLPDADLQAMERLLAQKSTTAEQRSLLHFGLAFVFDARGQYGQAAAHLERANALQAAGRAARGQSHDPDRHSRFIDRMIATFTPEVISRQRSWGTPDPRPVFVVGLPRSGTSLVEQVLASHPEVHGAGELYDVNGLFLDLPKLVGQPEADPFQVWTDLSPDVAQSMARRYLDRLDGLAPRAANRIVDKMPDNIRLLGMIRVLWPGAHVIVCHRDLRDVALSCGQTGFEKNAWASDWDHIAQRFGDHERIVKHWERAMPGQSLSIRYEDMVGDLESSARRLINYLGLDWNPSCLEFHKTRRVVRTASQVQVRQPLYTHSVGRWRNYEESLTPFLQACRRLGVDVESDA
jgi:tetratricopeptide (TPR) repeat protein